MKTNRISQTFILRLRQKRLGVLFFALAFLISLNGCQSPTSFPDGTYVNDRIRRDHARELLKAEYKKIQLATFEDDADMPEYIKSYISNSNPKLDSHEMTAALLGISNANRYDPVFLLAVMKTESQFNPTAIGSAGEIGIMQIKPSTAEWICKKTGVLWKGKDALKDPVYNMKIGALYFKYLKKSLKSKAAHYINAYNMGINNLSRLPATSKIAHPYYAKVMQNYLDIYAELRKIKKVTKST